MIASVDSCAEMALALSRSSINMRTWMSRAAHPRVNEPAVAVVANVPRQTAARAERTQCRIRLLNMTALLDVGPAGGVAGRDEPSALSRPNRSLNDSALFAGREREV